MILRGKQRVSDASYIGTKPAFQKHYSGVVYLFCLFMLVYGNLFRVTGQLFPNASVTPIAYATNESAPSTPQSPASPQTLSTQVAAGVPNQPAAVATKETPKSCTSAGYALPNALSLTSTATGLTSVIDPPTHYEVYGSSLPALRAAITNCPARRAAGSYHALTAYQLNWAYTPVATNGVCRLENVRVGLHVNQFMPMFSPGNTTPPSVTSTWDAYSQALKTHEDGHTALDIEYATRLATALQNTGNMDCATLTRQTQSIIDSHVTMLNTANELYDSQTNHGATQGAVL